MSFLIILFLSLIEGATEFLPVSSTGHLIIATAFLGLHEDTFTKAFDIMIQSGAILAVILLYWRRLKPDLQLYLRIGVAFLPAAVIGLLVKKKIDLILGHVWLVAAALIVGGFILIWAEKKWSHLDDTRKKEIKDLTLKECLILGLIQCLAFIPGVSRSGATLIGGLALGLSQKEAAVFSFFLAIPTILGASVVKGITVLPLIDPQGWMDIALGTLLSFVFAVIAIKFFIEFLGRVGLKPFGYYRIALGAILFVCIGMGVI